MGFRLSTRGRASFSKQPPTAPAIWNTAPRPSQQKDVCDRRLSQSQGVSKTLVKLSRPLGRPWHRVATLCSSVGLPQAQKWRRLWLSATLASLTTVSKKYSLVLPKTHGHARCDAKQHRTKQPSPQVSSPLTAPLLACRAGTAASTPTHVDKIPKIDGHSPKTKKSLVLLSRLQHWIVESFRLRVRSFGVFSPSAAPDPH
ncbi:uncharacterized protein BKA78DRAFT_306892 [Phyllosticta capitalensis]|uniref:uncharacterized protein n=1 Tax=Phyllosticta capitalensis TaxID=121624 RepID=UPI00312F73FA